MTYEERMQHRDLVDRSAELRARFAEGDDQTPITRADARELVKILEEILVQLSPERWERAMETMVEEAGRRSGSGALIK